MSPLDIPGRSIKTPYRSVTTTCPSCKRKIERPRVTVDGDRKTTRCPVCGSSLDWNIFEEGLFVGGAVNDNFPLHDQLGFKVYVNVFADLIESRYTQLPLTIGILGDWGAGKSFLLRGIRNEVNKRNKEKRNFQQPIDKLALFSKFRRKVSTKAPEQPLFVNCIEFNAWEYSSSEFIWPGLVRKIMDEMEKKFPRSYWKLLAYRVQYNFEKTIRQKRIDFFWAAIILLTIFTYVLWNFGYKPRILFETWLLLGIGGVVKLINEIALQPISHSIINLFQNHDYGKKIGYMEQIRLDLQKLSEIIGKESRIMILIDDLDRCEPEKAVQMLEAVKLLLTFEDAPFIILMGVDARIVSAAVENHYKDIFSYAGVSGYSYLEKIIQVPFQLPYPTEEELDIFLSEQTRNSDEEVVNVGLPVSNDNSGSNDKNSDLNSINMREVQFGKTEQETIRSFSPYFTRNPRYIKRFLNIYRLVRSMVIYNKEVSLQSNLEVLLEWLLLSFQWPIATNLMMQFYDQLLEEPDDVKVIEYLYKKTKDYVIRNKHQDILPLQLEKFVNERCKDWEWTDIPILRRYTVNFNPGIEANLSLDNTEFLQREETPT